MNIVEVAYAIYHSPLGDMVIRASCLGLEGLDFVKTKISRHPVVIEGYPQVNTIINKTTVQLDEYFEGRRTQFDLPLNIRGTVFQKEVWEALRPIPYAGCCSYKDIAQKVGRPAAVRAVGSAVGANPFVIILPCHRVINANNALGGYGGGLQRKKMLLNLEAEHYKMHS